MPRFLALIACLVALLAAAPPVPGQEATAPAAGGGLDLAAVVVFPSDLGNAGFGVNRGGYATLDQFAGDAAAAGGTDAADLGRRLQNAGWQRHYAQFLARPLPPGTPAPAGVPDPVATWVASSVTAYASAEGASAAFAVLRGGGAGTSEEAAAAAPLGDQVEVRRLAGLNPDGVLPFTSVNLSFRTGDLIADVTIQNNSTEEPPLTDVVALAARMRERIDAARAGDAPGLSGLVARTTGPVVVDGYVKLADRYEPAYLQPADAIAARERDFADVTDLYSFQAQPVGNAYYLVELARFPDAGAASAWLQGQPATTLTAEFQDYAEVAEVEAPALGDEARAFSYAYPAGTTNALGHAVFARVDNVVARVQLDAVPEAPPAGAVALAEAQVTCLRAGACPDAVTLPSSAAALPATPATP